MAFAAYAVHDLLTVVVTNDAVTLTRHETTRTIERSAVSVVFMSGKTLIVLGHDTDELVRENTDLNALALERAFTAHGFPWSPGDPHEDEYRRWVDDAPDLPLGANAVLKARQKALDKGADRDVKELRTELAKLNIVVRDEKKRQYWRPAHPRL